MQLLQVILFFAYFNAATFSNNVEPTSRSHATLCPTRISSNMPVKTTTSSAVNTTTRMTSRTNTTSTTRSTTLPSTRPSTTLTTRPSTTLTTRPSTTLTTRPSTTLTTRPTMSTARPTTSTPISHPKTPSTRPTTLTTSIRSPTTTSATRSTTTTSTTRSITTTISTRSTPPMVSTTRFTTRTLTTTTSITTPVCQPSNKPSPIIKDCQPGSCPRAELSCALQSSAATCQTSCDNTSGCIGYNYNSNTAYCLLYGDCQCPTTCGTGRPSPNQKDCQPGFCSRAEVGCSLENSEATCQTQCNNNFRCIGYNYNAVNDYCVLYGDCQCPSACGTDRPSPIRKDCQPGFCPRAEVGCLLENSAATCQNQCNNNFRCIGYNYNAANDYCVLYGDCQCPSTCDTDRPSPIQKDCQPGFCPRQEVGCSLSNTAASCQDNCNNNFRCIGYNYNTANDYCVLYGDCQCPSTCGSDRPSPIVKDCQPGSCPRREVSCSLSNSATSCQDNCNNDFSCIGYNYNSANDYCVLYGDCTCPALNSRLIRKGRRWE